MRKNTLTAIIAVAALILFIGTVFVSIKLCLRKGTPEIVSTAPVIQETPPVVEEPVSEEVPAAETPEIPLTKTVQMVRTTTTVNVRSDSNTDAKRLGSAVKGSEFEMIEALENGWTKIKYEDKEAYIKSDYLEEFSVEVDLTEEEIAALKESQEALGENPPAEESDGSEE